MQRLDAHRTGDDGQFGASSCCTLAELSQACRVDIDPLTALAGSGERAARAALLARHARLEGAAVRRAHFALRLAQDLELTPTGAALVIEMLDQLECLHAHLGRLREYQPGPRLVRVRQRTDVDPATA